MAIYQGFSLAGVPASDYYTWTFPGAPVRIHLHFKVIERLRVEVGLAFGSDPMRGAEIGGLLIGATDSHARSVTIEEFEPFPCDPRPDRRFVISEAAGTRFDMTLRRRRAKPYSRLKVVGYYRSHIRDGLGLREQDLALARACFQDPTNVFLVIKPSAGASPTAGFFFWERGNIESEFSFLEFPFDENELAGAWIKTVETGAAPHPEDEQAGGTVHQDLPGTGPAADEESPVGKDEGRPARTLSRLPLLRFVALLIALAVLGYPAYIGYTKWVASTSPVAAAGALALHVERREDKLRVIWNRESPAIKHAAKGSLSIRDGDSPPRELTLDGDQLRNGSVIYGPADDSVQVRLEVTGPDQTRTSEAVRVDAMSPKAGLTVLPPFESPEIVLSSSRDRASGTTPPAKTGSSKRALADPPPQGTALSQNAFPAVEQLAFSQPKLPPPPAHDLEQSGLIPQQPLPSPSTQPFVPAQAIHEWRPNLPPEVRATVTSEVEVRVKASVDVSGHVVSVDFAGSTAPVSNVLLRVTREAAMQWRFTPATRGSQPVASEVILAFRYIPAPGGM